MGLFSWIGIGVAAVLLVAGLIIKGITRQKVKDLDGFLGIAPKGEEEGENKPG